MAIQIVEQNTQIKLVETLTEIKSDSPYWRLVDFRFSELLEHYRSPVQIKIAVNLIYDLLKSFDGFIFVGQDSNITLLCRDVTPALLDKVVFQLRYLLMDDPLAYLANGEENPEFCKSYDLAMEYDHIIKLTKQRMVLLSRGPAMSKSAGPAQAGPSKLTLKPFTPQQLMQIERDLPSVDLTSLVRQQPVCAATSTMAAQRVFNELYIHIAPLRQLLRTDTDLLSNRWLFKYLTNLLDLRMLAFLTQHAMQYLTQPISINLNVDTILSQAFTEFDSVVKSLPKGSIVIEIPVSDVFTDMAAFTAAKAQLQRMGYRVCLDGLTKLSLAQIDRERLGFDLAKLQWGAELESDVNTKEVQSLAATIQKYGSNRIILCRCDNAQAVRFGMALGITLFQGRALDKLVNPASGVEN